MANLIDPLAEAAVGFASKLTGGANKQTELLDTTKTVGESAAQLIISAKEAAMNPKVIMITVFVLTICTLYAHYMNTQHSQYMFVIGSLWSHYMPTA